MYACMYDMYAGKVDEHPSKTEEAEWDQAEEAEEAEEGHAPKGPRQPKGPPPKDERDNPHTHLSTNPKQFNA